MKQEKIFFNPIEGTGPLTVSWYDGAKGDAIEAVELNGVGFFSPNGEILSVIFDEVHEKKDKQILRFKTGTEVIVEVVNGKVKSIIKRNVRKNSIEL